MTLVDSVQEFVVYLAVHIAVTAAKRIPAYVPEDAQVVENGFSEKHMSSDKTLTHSPVIGVDFTPYFWRKRLLMAVVNSILSFVFGTKSKGR